MQPTHATQGGMVNMSAQQQHQHQQSANQRRMQTDLSTWRPELAAALQRYSGGDDAKWISQINSVIHAIDTVVPALNNLLSAEQYTRVQQYYKQASETVQKIRLHQKINQANPSAMATTMIGGTATGTNPGVNNNPNVANASSSSAPSSSTTATTAAAAAAAAASATSRPTSSSSSSGGRTGANQTMFPELDAFIGRANTDRAGFVRSAPTIRRLLNQIEDPTLSYSRGGTITSTSGSMTSTIPGSSPVPSPSSAVATPSSLSSHHPSQQPMTMVGQQAQVGVATGIPTQTMTPGGTRSYAVDAAPGSMPASGTTPAAAAQHGGQLLLSDLTALQNRNFRLVKAPVAEVLEFKVRSPVTIPQLESHWPEIIITIPERGNRYANPLAPPITWRIATVGGTRDAGVPEALEKILKKAIDQARTKHTAALAATGNTLQSNVTTLPILADAWLNTVNTVMGALLRRYQQSQLQRQQAQQRAAAAAAVSAAPNSMVDGAAAAYPGTTHYVSHPQANPMMQHTSGHHMTPHGAMATAGVAQPTHAYQQQPVTAGVGVMGGGVVNMTPQQVAAANAARMRPQVQGQPGAAMMQQGGMMTTAGHVGQQQMTQAQYQQLQQQQYQRAMAQGVPPPPPYQ